MKSTLRSATGGVLVTLLASTSASAIGVTPITFADTLASELFLNQDGITVTDSMLTYGNSTGTEIEGGGVLEGDGENVAFAIEPDLGWDGTVPITPQSGTYINPNGIFGLPSPGIVMSTGNVTDYGLNPNPDVFGSSGDGLMATAAQNDLLGPITGQTMHFDPVQLDIEFDVTDPSIEVISFIAVFGSEEYPDFVGSSFIDGFGLFVNDQNVAGALVTGAADGDTPLPININHPDFADSSTNLGDPTYGTILNGVLAPNGIPLLRFDVPVEQGANDFTVIMADASDSSFDTTVYLSSFGDFTSSEGTSEFTPVLPVSNEPDENGTFVIELDAPEEGETIWIDPPVSVGFTYEATNAEFASITAPSLLTVNDPDGFEIVIDGVTYAITGGATFDIIAATGGSVTSFVLQGIDPALMLDPDNPLAFPLGVSLANIAGSVSIDMTPITVDVGGPDPVDPTPVPVPAAGLLYLAGLGGLGMFMRRRRAKANA